MAEQPDYNIGLTWDERQMVESLLGSVLEDAGEYRGAFSEIEHGILVKAHKKVADARPTRASVKRWSSGRKSKPKGGIQGLK